MNRIGMLLIACCITTIIGCGSSRDYRPTPPANTTITWPELKEFVSGGDYKYDLTGAAVDNEWDRVAKYVKGKEFTEAFEKFSKSSIPSGHASDKRQEAFETFIAKHKELIDAIEKEAQDDKKKVIVKEIQSAYETLRRG